MTDRPPRPKGQLHASLDDPGWLDGVGGQGRFTAYPLGDGEHDPVVSLVEYAPNVRIGVHYHDSDYFSMVLTGEIEITRRLEQPGSIRLVRAGTAYGPLVAGPEGCTVLEVFADRSTFVAPHYLHAQDQAAATSSPFPELFRQAIQACWTSAGEGASAVEHA